MNEYLQPKEKDILKALCDETEPVHMIDLVVKLHYFNTERSRIYLQRLKNMGFVRKRRPYERKAIVLTDAGRAKAAALRQEEAA